MEAGRPLREKRPRRDAKLGLGDSGRRAGCSAALLAEERCAVRLILISVLVAVGLAAWVAAAAARLAPDPTVAAAPAGLLLLPLPVARVA